MQSIDRAFAMLNLLSKVDEGMSVSELSKQMSLPVGTVHRFLISLAENGLVVQDSKTKFYKLGIKILSLASQYLKGNRLVTIARGPMQLAADQLGMVVYISQKHLTDVLCVASVEPTAGLHAKFAAQVGVDMPFNAAAAAKILFAYEPEIVLRTLAGSGEGLKKYTDKTKTTVEEILEDAHRNLAQGYAVCDEELEPGVIAVAAPVHNYDGTVIASVAVTGIKANCNLEKLVEGVCRCGRTISAAMGYSG